MASDSFKQQSRLLLLSRFLTHGGDQAWDLAVPLTLAVMFPDQLSIVALYYLIVRMTHTALVTRVSSLMDKWSRIHTARVGIAAQTIGVLLSAACMYLLAAQSSGFLALNVQTLLVFIVFLGAGVLASLGATVMDIAVVQDWLPIIAPDGRLSVLNSQFKRIDLATELGAPILAGFILASFAGQGSLTGFYMIAAWNFASFVPEYFLLRKVHDREGKLALERSKAVQMPKEGLLAKLRKGWRDFIAQPAALPMLAYAMLWVTILSPHGVILSAWLKTQWNLSETQIGIFRSFGAVFGLTATVIFPKVISKVGLTRAARGFIVFQAGCLIASGVFFSFGASYFLYFAAFILLSRIGLYGFSLGEVEIRQKMVDPAVKGRVNGTASALNSLATLFVYGLGTLFANGDDFKILVYGSILAVTAGAFIFSFWTYATCRAAGESQASPGS